MKKWQIIGAVFTIIVGSLLHFTFEWSSGNRIVGLFSAVNESTFEHLKLLITPVLLFAVIEYFAYGRKYPNFVPAKVLSVFVGMAVIVVLFYTYTGIIGQNFLAADIATFVLGVTAAYLFSCRILSSNKLSSAGANIAAWLLLAALIAGVVLFTLDPPRIELFRDPVTGSYGIGT